jgi:hypothetical protein
MEKKAIIIINEQHNLLKSQEEKLKERFGTWNTIKVPAKGWDIAEMEEILLRLEGECAVFVSPIPYMIGRLCRSEENTVFIFFNSKREKVEKDGKVFFRIPEEGWELVEI